MDESDIVSASWPEVDASALEQDSIKMMIQVNGKLRGDIAVAASASKDEIETMALADENIIRFIAGQAVKKVIVVPKRLVNIVV